MNKFILQREIESEQGCFGTLRIFDKIYNTLELPWKENKNNISRIPVGTYPVRWSLSPRLRVYTYEIMNVPDRGGVRIHSGNLAGNPDEYQTHSKGCPLLGYKRGIINGQKAILNSRLAVKAFERQMDKQTFLLEVREHA